MSSALPRNRPFFFAKFFFVVVFFDFLIFDAILIAADFGGTHFLFWARRFAM